MNRRHHHNIQPYDYDRFSVRNSRDRDQQHQHQAKGIEYQDDSLSSVNSDEDSYLHTHNVKEKKDGYFSKISLSKSNKPEKGANSEPTFHHHQNEMKVSASQTNNENSATAERLNRLENMLEELLKHNTAVAANPPAPAKQSQKLTQESNDGRFLLEPRRHDFTTSMWINKIQDVAMQNNYSESSTIKFMESQMSGIIKAWYKSLPNYDFSWPEWKLLLTKTFPDNVDFITTLKRLVTRLKQADETITNYYFSKMYLIEACKITGEDAVSCLIDGLNNQGIQEQAKLQNYLTPETLFSQFLMSLPDYTVDYLPLTGPTPEGPNNWFYQEPEPNIQESGIIEAVPVPHDFHFENEERLETINFNSQEPTFVEPDNLPRPIQFEPPPKRSGPVHSRLDKRFIKSSKFSTHNNKVPLAAKVCSVCHNRGHIARNCRRSNNVMAIEILGNRKSEKCYVKKCFVNGKAIMGFIDTGCNGVLLREEDARILGLAFHPSSEVVRSFGGRKITALGQDEVLLQIDNVASLVKVTIMPNRVQEFPVIIGQSFLNQKDVSLIVKNDCVTIFKAPK